jgi:hypothetical protein
MKENMFSDYQLDFRPNHSAEAALNKSAMYSTGTNLWTKGASACIAVFMDLEKACAFA